MMKTNSEILNSNNIDPNTFEENNDEWNKESDKKKDMENFQKMLEEQLSKEKDNIGESSTKKVEPIVLLKPIDLNIGQVDEEGFQNSNKEEIEKKMEILLGKEIVSLLNSSKWEDKKIGFIGINDWVNINMKYLDLYSEIILYFIKHKLKDFKESNVNVIREAANSINTIVRNMKSKDKRLGSMIIKGLSEKLGDAKLKEQINVLLITLMEHFNPAFVVPVILKIIEKSKAPSTLKEFAIFFEKTIEEFSIDYFPVKDLVGYSKILVNHSNPQIRNNGTSLLCILYKYVGNEIRALLKDIKDSTLKVIEAEFEKVQVIDRSTLKAPPKRVIKDDEENPTIKPKMEELIPRIDISKKIAPKMIKDLSTGKWPEKKEACETIEKIILAANKKILPNGLNELFGVIKSQLADGNKNVIRIVVSLVTLLIESIGAPFKNFTKGISTNLISNLSDKQVLLRQDVNTCLEKWIENLGLDSLGQYLPTFLKQDNFEMRTELLKLLLKYKADISKLDLKEFAFPLLNCLLDKTGAIRSTAEEFIAETLKFTSINTYYDVIKNFDKPAIIATIENILSKFENNSHLPNSVSQGFLESYSTVFTKKEKDKDKDFEENFNNLTSKSKISTKTTKDLKTVSPNTTPSKNENKTPTKSSKIQPKIQINNYSTNKIEKNMNLIENRLKISKDKRIENDIKFKINLENINDEYINKTKDFLFQFFSKDLIEKLFSDNITKNVEGINLFKQLLNIDNPFYLEMIENIDLVIKYLGIKSLNNQNPILLKPVFEILEIIHETFIDNEVVSLSIIEFSFIFSILIDKLGNPNQKIQENSKVLIKKFSKLAKTNESISLLIKLSSNKTNKIKTECLEIINELISDNEVNINPSDIKYLAKMLALNDRNLKNVIMNILFEVYNKIQDDFWVIIDDVPHKIIEFLNNKFNSNNQIGTNLVSQSTVLTNKTTHQSSTSVYSRKRDTKIDTMMTINKEKSKPRESKIDVGHLKSKSPNSIKSSNVETVNKKRISQNLGNTIQSVNNPKLNTHNNNIGERKSNFALNNQSNFTNTINANSNKTIKDKDYIIGEKKDLIEILENLNNGSDKEKVNTILIIHELIFTKYENSKWMLIPNIDLIINSFITALKNLFNYSKLTDIPLKFGKYLVTVLYKITSNKELIQNTTVNTLYNLSEEVLADLLIEDLDKLGENQEGVIIIRSLNSTMLRILDNCNPTDVYIVLLELVRTYRLSQAKLKIANLGIKCLIKLNEALSNIIDRISIRALLVKIHEILIDFEKTNPQLQVKTQNDQMILKYIQNLVSDITQLKKEIILDEYNEVIPKHQVFDKYLIVWIKNTLSYINFEPKQSNKDDISELINNLNVLYLNNGEIDFEIMNKLFNQLKQNNIELIKLMNNFADKQLFNKIYEYWDTDSKVQTNQLKKELTKPGTPTNKNTIETLIEFKHKLQKIKYMNTDDDQSGNNKENSKSPTTNGRKLFNVEETSPSNSEIHSKLKQLKNRISNLPSSSTPTNSANSKKIAEINAFKNEEGGVVISEEAKTIKKPELSELKNRLKELSNKNCSISPR